MVERIGAWLVASVHSTMSQTPSARRITLDVPDWPGSAAGQHIDVRLTAPDGYTAVRSYSLASWGTAPRIELAVDEVPNGEVSPYLVQELQPGDQLEIRGPLGAWFVWEPTGDETTTDGGATSAPVQLICGGSGIVPLMAMIRAHADTESPVQFRLLYSVRSPADVFFADELASRADSPFLDVTFIYTRQAPDGWPIPVGRATRAVLAAATLPAADAPAVFVCGPTGFVESVADSLVALGHDPLAVKTERFGGA
ncbi:ferredoxin reductase [Leifsonia sp. A12D58]|uniref:ferredoxin reductase n=1 Tax=Leifsonia sp. A12D58 TaxID=3397674 RepID=UPI0039E12364